MDDVTLFEASDRDFLSKEHLDSFEWYVSKWKKERGDKEDLYSLSFSISDGNNLIYLVDDLNSNPEEMVEVAKKLRRKLKDFILAVDKALEVNENV